MPTRPSFRKFPRGGARPFVRVRKLVGSGAMLPQEIFAFYTLRLLLVHSQALIQYYLKACKHMSSSGVWRHAPPGKFAFRLSEIASDAFSGTDLILFECS